MLILPLKPGVRYDLGAALGRWLDSDQEVSFQPMNPLQFILPKPDFSSAACREDLLRLQSLRNSVTDSISKTDSHKSALSEGCLEESYEYHAVLLEFEKRGFPAVDDETTPIQITWKGAFSEEKEKHASLVWERSVITYNIVAMLTAKAAACSVTERDQCKETVKYSQQAAGLLAILRELVESQDFATVDLSSSMLFFWEKYLIAQAQLSIYRMASLGNTDNSKHGTLSFLTQSAHELFNEALSAAQDPRLQSEITDDSSRWGAYCKTLSMLSAAKAEFHQSVQHRLAHEWGKEIARLRDCKEKLEKLQSFIKSLDCDSVVSYEKRELLAILPVVTDRLNEADTDNYKIYQDEIPKAMPEIVAKKLANVPSGLPENMLVTKRDLFLDV